MNLNCIHKPVLGWEVNIIIENYLQKMRNLSVRYVTQYHFIIVWWMTSIIVLIMF